MNRFTHSKIFFWTVEILLLVLTFFVLYQVQFIFTPVRVIFNTVVPPVLIALFLYYLFHPITIVFEKVKIPKPLTVLGIFLGLIIFFVVIITGVIPEIAHQTTQLIANFPTFMDGASQHLSVILKELNLGELEAMDMSIFSIVQTTMSGFFSGIGSVAGSIWNAVIIGITAPIVLIYIYKDGAQFFEKMLNLTPRKHRSFIENIFSAIHRNLQSYIVGQAIVCLYVGISLFIIYRIIGIPYAFLLGLIAGIMDIIPYAGPWIGAIPAIIIAFSISPMTALIVAIAIIVIQLGESYIVSPYVMGKSLHLHPITVIFVLLIAGKLGGIIGMVLGIPVFVIAKVMVEETITYMGDPRDSSVYLKQVGDETLSDQH